jgi:hypothetical protein
MMKVGKADDVHKRIKTLRRHWGEVDYAASYCLEAPMNVVFRLERSILLLLAEQAMVFETGDGKTELFELAALERALQYIEIFASQHRLVKGVPKPAVIVPGPELRVRSELSFYRKTRKASREMVQTATKVAQQFDEINRWLLVLLRRRHRIAYQYAISEDESEVTFRIRGPIAESIWHSFVFIVRDLNNSRPMSCLSGSSSDGFAHFTITVPPQGEALISGSRDSLLLAYFAKQTLMLLKRLPTRSEAAADDLPDLDGAAVLTSILSRYQTSKVTGGAN